MAGKGGKALLAARTMAAKSAEKDNGEKPAISRSSHASLQSLAAWMLYPPSVGGGLSSVRSPLFFVAEGLDSAQSLASLSFVAKKVEIPLLHEEDIFSFHWTEDCNLNIPSTSLYLLWFVFCSGSYLRIVGSISLLASLLLPAFSLILLSCLLKGQPSSAQPVVKKLFKGKNKNVDDSAPNDP
ncbi:hypothetical protein GUJ93_ZPchr0007g4655 [Zizania palustris]|uniref:Uncharacterized protein n=1 Tax=Zizania palustris TaxID=103762 RepID=A0A8J5T8E8_ZIZPA|nr:hypothetical protein GUJ93_ZPchr0007g4655 [Zizania palustris]